MNTGEQKTLTFKAKLIDFRKQREKDLMKDKKIANFKPGCTINVEFKQQGLNRSSTFTGICIWKRKKLEASSFAVIKDVDGCQITKTFVFSDPNLISVTVKKISKTNRAKLFYLTKTNRRYKNY